MAYEDLVDLNPDTTVAIGGRNNKTGKTNPTKVEGYYLGSRKVDSKKAKNGYAYIHVFQTSAGNIGVWGKTDLDRKILSVTPGTMTLVAFDRMVPTPNGEMYKFKVSVDKENTIEVSVATDSTPNYATNDDTTDSETDDDDTTDDDNEASQAAALTAAERQAKVQEMLRGKGKTK